MGSVVNGPPPPDTNYAPTFLGVTGTFTLLAIGLCGARIWSKSRPGFKLRVDDYLVAIATVLCTVGFFLSVGSSVHGWGHHSAYVSPADTTTLMKLNFVQQVIWIGAIAITRLSIALSLLRLSPDRAWKWILWAVIAIQVITYAGHMLFQFANCRPLKANWMPMYDVRCWPRKYVLIFGWVANGILVALDVILALLPIHLIRTLNRTTREKMLICCLMAMGLLAAVIAAYRMGISDKTFAGDLVSGTVMMSMWCMLEVLLGIIAACLAPLKAHAERFLHRVGLLASRGEMTRPSFVMSLAEQGGDGAVPPSRSTDDSGLKDSMHSGERKETKKVGVDAVEVDHDHRDNGSMV
ncbi:hypothetical protein BU23DRAFT_521228 [Bimuria novae-zelandiae CBS 107.79]|uniref:Rhodopsin domain-containing protein n=1 Tax=Bimuria novae-zelandiae CBS 107.79 TaxID=1447943 RepID=A0A6A5UHM1_9PLEO|nr:hypothetical protein BU23DRAFT_521228 [Bimuria novae-zelandiae CBS 107.79]